MPRARPPSMAMLLSPFFTISCGGWQMIGGPESGVALGFVVFVCIFRLLLSVRTAKVEASCAIKRHCQQSTLNSLNYSSTLWLQYPSNDSEI